MKNDNYYKLSASLEDYLEAIYNLTRKGESVGTTDIARLLEVTKPSVTGALKLLREKGLVNYKPYNAVTLTKRGTTVASEVVRKHNILTFFFGDILGMDAESAQISACQAEHTLGPKVMKKLVMFIDFINSSDKDGYDLAEEFKEYCHNRQGS